MLLALQTFHHSRISFCKRFGKISNGKEPGPQEALVTTTDVHVVGGSSWIGEASQT